MKTRKCYVRRHAQKTRRTKKYKGGTNAAYDEYPGQYPGQYEKGENEKTYDKRIERERKIEKERKREYDQANEIFMNDPASGTTAEKEKYIEIYDKQYTPKKNKTNKKIRRNERNMIIITNEYGETNNK